MFCPYYILICSRSQFKRVPVYSFPCLRTRRLRGPRRGGGVHPERLRALSSALPKSIAELPSGSHAPHGQVDASLIYSVHPAGRVGARHVAIRLDFSHRSLCEQKESNPRANNALSSNNLQIPNPVTLVNSYTYKIGGGDFSGRINSCQAARIHRWSVPHPTISAAQLFQLSTFNFQPLQVQSPRSIQEPASPRGIDER